MRSFLAHSLLVLTSLLAFSTKSHATTPFFIIADGGSVFLGCINCGKYDDESINNRYGDYGSPYSTTSIYNAYGDYGSRYSDTSACNPNASNPPVIIDGNRNILGYLTVNRRIRNVALDPRVLGACSR